MRAPQGDGSHNNVILVWELTMPLLLTEEQSMLRDSARGLISDKAPVAHLRKLRDSKDEARLH